MDRSPRMMRTAKASVRARVSAQSAKLCIHPHVILISGGRQEPRCSLVLYAAAQPASSLYRVPMTSMSKNTRSKLSRCHCALQR